MTASELVAIVISGLSLLVALLAIYRLDLDGLTQLKLAHDLGISQNHIPAIEAGARKAGPRLQQAMVKYFGVRFEDLFEVVLVNPETGQEQVLERRS